MGTLVFGRREMVVVFLFGLVVPACLGLASIYCAKVSFEIDTSGLVVGGLFGKRAVSPSRIRRLVESNAPRQARSVTAYDDRDVRLFCLTDNVQDYLTAVGLIKQLLLPGTMVETHDGFSVSKRIAPLFGKHRDTGLP